MLILLSISLSACKSRTVKIAILLSVLILFSAFFQKRFLQIINNYPIPGYYNSIHRDYNPPLISSIKILPDTNWYTKFEWNPNHTDSVNVLHYYLKQNSFYNTPTYSLTVSFSYYINNYISDYMLSCQKPQEAEIGKLLGLFNIKNVMFQQDNVFKDYKRYCPERLSQQNYLTKKQTIGAIDIYVNDPINFLQKIYSPADIIISDKKITDLVNIVSEKDYSPQSAIFFEQDNQAEAISDIQNIVDHKDPSSPVIEYKKINPTKYKLIVHGAKASFPLVFSESFHSGWKAYVKPTRDTVAQSEESLIDKTKNYYVHQNNKEDQATREELAGFIDIGLISNLGEKQSPDFVSKIFSGTIQNDNMDDGSVSETWFRQPVEEKYHLKANGYANSWIIDPIKICSESNKCIKNPDGSYDIEIVIDFWPQRLLYLGSFISGSTIFGFMIYIIYNWRKNKMVKTRISVIKKKNA